MSDLWKNPPLPPGEREPEEPEKTEASEPESDKYEARHHAAGRPPLVRRKARRLRDQRDPEEPAVEKPSLDELLASRPEDLPRWRDEDASALWPQAPEVTDEQVERKSEPLPSRAELRRTRRIAPPEGPRSQDYVGRHLAPKKRTLFAKPSRAMEEDAFVSREEIADEPLPEDEPLGHEVAAMEDGSMQGPVTEEVEEVPVAEAQVEEVVEESAEVQAEAPQPEAPQPEAPQPEDGEALELEAPLEPAEEVEEASPEEIVLPEVDDEAEPDAVIELEPEPEPEPHAALAPPPPPTEVEPAVVAVEGSDEDLSVTEPGENEEPLGPRRQKLQQRRRRTRIAQIIGSVLLSAALIVGAVILGGKVIDEVSGEKVAETTGAAPAVREPTTTLIFGTKGEGASKEALWMTLLTYDPEDEQGAVVYIPAHTAVEVPGRGLQGVGESYATGGVPLLLVSAENLLGVQIDSYIEMSETAARDLFDATGSLAVNVPSELRVAVGEDEARLILLEGEQEVDPSLLVKMLYLRGIDGDDVELGSRHLAFWDSLLDTFAEGNTVPAVLEEAASAFEETDGELEDHERLFATLAALPTGDLTITTLPVRPISAGESELYAANEAEVRDFLTNTIGFAAPASEDVRVQVLNGNGVPGIGQDVADRLLGEGFRVILSGNARRLTYRNTLIITYDDSLEGQRIAERAKRLLGVGEVQVSAQQQGIVDLTIVVGKDFLRAD